MLLVLRGRACRRRDQRRGHEYATLAWRQTSQKHLNVCEGMSSRSDVHGRGAQVSVRARESRTSYAFGGGGSGALIRERGTRRVRRGMSACTSVVEASDAALTAPNASEQVASA